MDEQTYCDGCGNNDCRVRLINDRYLCNECLEDEGLSDDDLDNEEDNY